MASTHQISNGYQNSLCFSQELPVEENNIIIRFQKMIQNSKAEYTSNQGPTVQLVRLRLPLVTKISRKCTNHCLDMQNGR